MQEAHVNTIYRLYHHPLIDTKISPNSTRILSDPKQGSLKYTRNKKKRFQFGVGSVSEVLKLDGWLKSSQDTFEIIGKLSCKARSSSAIRMQKYKNIFKSQTAKIAIYYQVADNSTQRAKNKE